MDKREAVRVLVRVRAQCRASGVVVDGLVEDVSRSGMFMRIEAPNGPIARGSSAEIELDVMGEPPIHLSAEIVRVDGSGFGLKLVENGSRPLANLIMRQHAVTR
jgi:hypothetical protein